MAEEEGLLRVEDVIDSRYSHLFHAHGTFNHMQSAILHQALQTDENMVVAAPTGSGKTVIHEVAVVRLLSREANKPLKIVYVAPNKALCQQRMREWDAKFTPLGQKVLEVTGDIDFKQCLRLVAKANIIITTPEKWDSLTRSWKDHIFLLGAIDLLLIDEIHHLAEDRGATLEALIVRMRMLRKVYAARTSRNASDNGPTSRYTYNKLCQTLRFNAFVTLSMRIIALSATLPNLADIGEWLGCRHDAIHYFDETFRPVPLTVHTLAMGSMSNPFLFDKSLDERVGPIVMRYSEGRQVLVFCPSKKSTEHLSSLLAQRVQMPSHIATETRRHAALIDTAQTDALRQLLHRGVAYHHAGLPPDDRSLVEQLYLARALFVLSCTSTLAHGVNLPAHLVIIKGTSCWRGGTRGYERTSRADVIQMLGRAGRPGMDEAGVAVIMTSREDEGHYADVSLNAEVVESTLQNTLVEGNAHYSEHSCGRRYYH
jgi:ATP-dependent DNA helicase HFM1/MER3